MQLLLADVQHTWNSWDTRKAMLPTHSFLRVWLTNSLSEQTGVWSYSTLSNCPQAWPYYCPSSTKTWSPLANCGVSTYTKQAWGHRPNALQIHTLRSHLISSVPKTFPLEMYLSKLNSSNSKITGFFPPFLIQNYLNCSSQISRLNLSSFF